MASDLLRCPFCGFMADIKERSEVQYIDAYSAQHAGMGQSATSITHRWYEVECSGCHATVSGYDAEKAITKWNRRT